MSKYPCAICVGTSGYSYAEWLDAGFYPPDTKPGEMLQQYVRRFSVTELNYTWYQMPRAPAIERMRQQVPPDFQFAAKLTRYLTHEIDADQWRVHAGQYRDGIAPLIQSGQLAAVLVQFPPSFQRTPRNRHYLAALLDELHGLRAAVEFRHASWATERVYVELERRQTALVSVDAPDLKELFPRLDIVTCPDLFYIRFHGRNTRGGGPATCRNSSTTTTRKPNCTNGRKKRSNAWPGRPATGCFFSTTMSGPRRPETLRL
jgi:uncharacterized protein YecE (DUF72 family)